MLRKLLVSPLTTSTAKVAVKSSVRLFKTSTPTFGCYGELPDEMARRVARELRAERTENNSIINKLKKQNKAYEIKLCDTRSLLTFLYRGADKNKIPDNIQSRINTHIDEHREHRKEEHSELLAEVKNKAQQVSEQVKLNEINLAEVESEIPKLQLRKENIQAQLFVEKSKLQYKKQVLNEAIKRLENSNTDSDEFLIDRESTNLESKILSPNRDDHVTSKALEIEITKEGQRLKR